MTRRLVAVGLSCFVFAGVASGQTPRPFPRSGESGGQASPAAPVQATSPTPPRPVVSAPAAVQAPVVPPQTAPADPAAPSESTLGFPVYPGARFLASYDAGKGQRYYLFGTTSPFTELVNYYRTQLKEKGNLVFEQPATHMFEVGRFRDDTMAFPPGVTVKDWTSGGSKGYPNPKMGEEPARFPTVIMIVPAPAGAGGR
jgi:hypothetical protein